MTDKIRVLIVDDNEINRMLAAEIIQSFGLEAVTAENGIMAMSLADNDEFAFALMDHIMPGMDGVEVTRAILSRHDLPIYAMTGDLTVQIAAQFEAAGAAGSIEKPLRAEQILKIIRDCVPEGSYSVDSKLMGRLQNDDISQQDLDHALGSIKLSSYLSTVAGLDYTSGLNNALGNEESYLRILKASSNNIREYVAMLSEYLQTADPQKLKLASHSLKSVFANIGHEMLQRESAIVETTASELLQTSSESGDIASFDRKSQDEMNDYISHTMKAALELEEAISAYESAQIAAKGYVDYNVIEAPLSVDDMTEAIEYTRKAISKFEFDGCLEGLGYLCKASRGSERKSLENAIEAINNFKYDMALGLLEEVANLKKGRGEAR